MGRNPNLVHKKAFVEFSKEEMKSVEPVSTCGKNRQQANFSNEIQIRTPAKTRQVTTATECK